MSNYEVIKAATNAYIKTNGRREITGAILNAVMIATIDSLGKFYQFVGRAEPDTDPGVIDQNIAYLASTPGTYTNLGGFTLDAGELAVIKFDGEWHKEAVATIPAKVSQLQNDLGFITNAVSDLVNYYTKGETFTKSEVQGILLNYYDRDEVDSIVSVLTRQSYVVAWDGTAEPVVGDIPAGVSVTWGGNPYVGTLPASASTIGRIYLVSNGAGYDEYITTEDGGYSWISIGTTSIDLSDYATKAEVSQLEAEVIDLALLDLGTQYKSVYVGNDPLVGAVGDIITDTSSNSFAVELDIPVGAYEVYFYSRNWSTGSRGWAFLDGNGVVLSYAKLNVSANITIPVPSGAVKVRLTLYTGKKDVTFHTKKQTKDIINESATSIGKTFSLDDARLVLREKTNSSSQTDDPDGTRIRILFQVVPGLKLYARTTDTRGIYVGVYDSVNNALKSGSAGLIQSGVGYTTEWVDYDVQEQGFLAISLSNGTTAITDERKQELLDSLSLALGYGMEFDLAKDALLENENTSRIDKIQNPNRTYPYYGEKINVGGGFDWYAYATNAAGGQSSALYGDYLFIVLDELAKVKCYNVKTRTLLCECTPGLTPEETWHCNQTSFGIYRYDSGDKFPVMYISMRNDAQGRCSALGFRIIPTLTDGEITAFTISLVQTIKFPAMTDANCLGNVNATFDVKEGFLWGYSRNNNNLAENYNLARFTRFAIPDLSQSLVELSDADIQDAFSDDWSMLNAQGGFIGNGKLVIMQGFGSSIYCRIIDLYLQKKQVTLIDLAKAGVTYEPEGAFYYEGKIMASTSGANIIAIEYD